MGLELAAQKVEMDDVEDANLSDFQLVRHVRDALSSAVQGDLVSYDQLLSVIHRKKNLSPDEVALLVTCLKALSGAVSFIDITYHDALLTSIFGMNLWNYGRDVMGALIELITSLVGSGKYIDSCLEMLVSNFAPPRTFLDLLKQPLGSARKGQVISCVHSALEVISDLVPLAPARLLPIVVMKMPNIYAQEKEISVYVENMLILESSALGDLVGNTLLTAVMDRLIDFDVEIKWKDILCDDSSKGIFEMELEDLDDFPFDDDAEDFEIPGGFTRSNNLNCNILAEKLDSLLVLMFEHLKSCHENGRLVKIFETLLKSFEMTVMSAHEPKFTQFVLFYACSLDPDNCGVRFANLLADIFTQKTYPLKKRRIAIAYLAGFLSRANFLPLTFVVKMLQRLVNWCWTYCQVQESEIIPQAHLIFYDTVQAILYVLCFRMRSIIDDSRLLSELTNSPLEAIFKHRLIPLKGCLPIIVEEFLRQSRAAGLFTSTQAFVFDNMLKRETFFPLDPCLLRKSAGFLQPTFIYWSMVNTTYDDEDENSEDEAEVYLGSAAIDAMATSFVEEEFDLEGFNKMSITPKSINYKFGRDYKKMMPSRIRPSTSPESL
ncbi:RNA polymerase I-specific transcription initiation factor RRN3-like [Impatiens glandulifera]|uniref:RNA polymerase I-specific transcription initiation factor RRN3-like n=1 Tax=Impatiens glandulifera TaxID=253017 RepID=UPI001FB06C76|nr:RNA polymerase I-specific transcription initiation factor RRN3-like [Impatiens glandulifera]